MTGGGGLLVTLVIDFYRNDENDEESRVSTYTRAMLLIVDELQAYTRMGVFLSLALSLFHSQSLLMLMWLLLLLLLLLPAIDDDARNGE